MEDREIVALFLDRDEKAIKETETKYGERCKLLAFRILNSEEDSMEAVNDTLLKAWNTIPPQNPEKLFPYLAMLCRRQSIDMLRKSLSEKRGGGAFELSFEELDSCLPGRLRQGDVEGFSFKDALESFLEKLPEKKRIIFMRRYWWCCSISEIAEDMNMSESSVKMTLSRLRDKLRDYLEKEGINI